MIRGMKPSSLFPAVVRGIVLLAALASAAHAGPLWEDTVLAGGRGGQANAVVTDGVRVYAGGFVATPDGDVALVRSYAPRSGALVWEDRPSFGDASLHEIGSLSIDGGRLFATAFVTRAGTGRDWVVRTWDATTGALLWEDVRDDGRSGWAHDVAARDGHAFVVGEADDAPGGRSRFVLRAYDAATGSLRWDRSPGPQGTSEPGYAVSAHDGRVFAAGPVDDTVHVGAWSADDGRELWSAGIPGSGTAEEIAVAGGRVFVAVALARDLLVVAYDDATGAELWQRRITGRPAGSFDRVENVGLAATADLVVAGRTLAGDVDLLVAWSADTGAPAWQLPDPGVTRDLQVDGPRVLGVRGASALRVRGFALGSGALALSTALDPDRASLALAHDGPLLFVAGVAGPGFGTFHVAALDTRVLGSIRPIVPRGTRLPLAR